MEETTKIESVEQPKKERYSFWSKVSPNAYFVGGLILLSSLVVSLTIVYSGQSGAGKKQAVAPIQQEDLQPEKPTGPVDVSADDDAVLGDKNAPVTLIEFSDFQCPFCRKFAEDTLPQLKKEYIDTGKAKLVYRDYPLPFHAGATPAAEGGECAKEQGKFWQYHDTLFQEQAKQGNGTVEFTVDDLKKWAVQAGLNGNSFNQCLDSGKYKDEVAKDLADGEKAGVSGTPTTFVNGTPIVGAQPFAALKTVIDEELKKASK